MSQDYECYYSTDRLTEMSDQELVEIWLQQAGIDPNYAPDIIELILAIYSNAIRATERLLNLENINNQTWVM